LALWRRFVHDDRSGVSPQPRATLPQRGQCGSWECPNAGRLGRPGPHVRRSIPARSDKALAKGAETRAWSELGGAPDRSGTSVIDFLRDAILVITAGIVLAVMYRGRERGMPRHVSPLIVGGFALLLAARLLDHVPAETLSVSPLTKGVIQEIFGYCIGFVLLMGGIVRWLPSVLGSRKSKDAADPAPRARRRRDVTSSPALAAKRDMSAHTAQEMLNSVLRSSLAGVLVLRSQRDDVGELVDFECVRMNEAAEQILGVSSARLVGRAVFPEIACIKKEEILNEVISVLETGLPFKAERLFTQGRSPRWFQFVIAKLGDGLAVTFADISARKRAEEQLRHAAQHDALTGLSNRALFAERLQQAINRTRRFREYKFAVIFLDFDRFKIINDSLGHDAGDQLLIGIADRLRANLRSIDAQARIAEGHLPARLGGDEFVILLENINDVRDAVRVAERIQRELAAPYIIDGHEVFSTASMGIVTSDLGYERPDDILRDADTAMYRAKSLGKARHVVFDEQMHQEVVRRLELERELRDAVEAMAFRLEFAPIVDSGSGRIAAFEALIRWSSPSRGPVPTSEFIALAEELSLMVRIGDWVVNEACRQLRHWHTTFPAYRDLGINVNLSRMQLVHPELIPTIRAALAKSGVDAAHLELEVTESMVLDGRTAVADVLAKLKEVGVRIVLDDFGTGQSSLACLQQFPIDVLKIDQDLIGQVKTRRDYGAIVKAIVELAHNLDLTVVAEGVETADQFSVLQSLRIDMSQGHFFSRPLEPEGVERLLSGDARFTAAA
jgi:diguanylate cyclase (GGDEF)-like protein